MKRKFSLNHSQNTKKTLHLYQKKPLRPTFLPDFFQDKRLAATIFTVCIPAPKNMMILTKTLQNVSKILSRLSIKIKPWLIFLNMALSCAVKNGYAHLKNFDVLSNHSLPCSLTKSEGQTARRPSTNQAPALKSLKATFFPKN